MPEAGGSPVHQQALVVLAFLAGVAMTALVVVVQAPASFRVAAGPIGGESYFEILVTAIALVGSVSVFGVLAAMEVAGGLAQRKSPMDTFGYVCFLVALFGVATVLPLLLVPFTHFGAALLAIVEGGLLGAYFSASGIASGPRGPKAGSRTPTSGGATPSDARGGGAAPER